MTQELFTSEETLAGLPARRESALLFLIESRTAHVVAQSRQARDIFPTKEGGGDHTARAPIASTCMATYGIINSQRNGGRFAGEDSARSESYLPIPSSVSIRKPNVTASVGTMAAHEGKRMGVIDIDI